MIIYNRWWLVQVTMAWLAVLCMGLVLGVLGGGGGILTVPILVGFFGMGATEATGSSLFIVGLASSVGAVQGLIKKQVDWQTALLIAVPSTIGAFVARTIIVPAIPYTVFGVAKDDLLLSLFATLMVFVGIKMLRKSPKERQAEANRFSAVVLGIVIGMVSGLLGAGGGFLILPALTLLLGLDMAKAIPTSLVVITVQSLGGFIGELGKPIQWNLLGGIAAMATVGLVLGTIVRDRVPKKTLKTSFAILVFIVALWIFWRVLS